MDGSALACLDLWAADLLEAILEVDSSGAIKSSNHDATALFGMTPQAITKANIRNLLQLPGVTPCMQLLYIFTDCTCCCCIISLCLPASESRVEPTSNNAGLSHQHQSHAVQAPPQTLLVLLDSSQLGTALSAGDMARSSAMNLADMLGLAHPTAMKAVAKPGPGELVSEKQAATGLHADGSKVQCSLQGMDKHGDSLRQVLPLMAHQETPRAIAPASFRGAFELCAGLCWLSSYRHCASWAAMCTQHIVCATAPAI